MRKLVATLGTASALILGVFIALPTPAEAATVGGSGNITALSVSETLNCGLDLETNGLAFNNGQGCGTVVAAHDKLSRPSYFPVGTVPTASTAWLGSGQTITGSGTRSDPFVLTTTVLSWGLRVTQQDTFVADESSYDTKITVKNEAQAATAVAIYHVADCFGQSYGELMGGPTVTCRTANGSYNSKAPGIQFTSTSADAFYGTAADLWGVITEHKAFSNTVGPGTSRAIDGVIGLSWITRLDALDTDGACPRGGTCEVSFTYKTTYQKAVADTATQAPATSAPPPANPTTQAPPPASSGTDDSNIPSFTVPGAATTQAAAPSPSPTQATTAAEPSPTPEAEASPTPEPEASPTPAPEPTGEPELVADIPAATSAAAEPGPEGESGSSVAQKFLDSPWSYAAVGVLGLGGVAGASFLRRHGRPE
ncbi:MAG: hypothetical protein LBR33_12540 [Propionibacteriaceae bacterium]|jgi:hypothetical protein|nr:hypothetical protein [Propionibacteriaceae bacterium]